MTIDTISNTDLITTIDFGQTLETMIAAGKYDWTNPNITARKFPIEGSGIKKFRNKLFHFGRDLSSKDAVTAIKRDGFEPATHVHGLAYGAAFPDKQRKYPIACLGLRPGGWRPPLRLVPFRVRRVALPLPPRLVRRLARLPPLPRRSGGLRRLRLCTLPLIPWTLCPSPGAFFAPGFLFGSAPPPAFQ